MKKTLLTFLILSHALLYSESGYPKLGMWWPDTWKQSAEDIARYDFTGFSPWENIEVLRKIKKINPLQYHLMSISVTETPWEQWEENSSLMEKIPDVWFLTQQGSVLSRPLNISDKKIHLEKIKNKNGEHLFKKGDTICCGKESMRVLGVNINKKELTVERGFVRRAEKHNRGDRIAAHITSWPKTWVMNLSIECPEYDAGRGPEKWITWSVKKYFPEIYRNFMDGLIIDRIERDETWLVSGGYARSIDPDCSNRIIKDNYEAFNKSWQKGIREILMEIRKTLKGRPFTGNSFGAYSDLLNGTFWEACPGNWSDTRVDTFEDWEERILGKDGYIEVSSRGRKPNFSFVETYEFDEYVERKKLQRLVKRPGYKPNYRKMRFGLTTALLGNGYFSYEINTNGHGGIALLWFDEYDNAGEGRGYLGKPEGKAWVVMEFPDGKKVYRRNYENGIVICNPTDKTVEIDLEKKYKKINGNQVPEINNGRILKKISILPRDGIILLKEKDL